MTEKTDPEWFTCPGLAEGARVAVQLTDGTLVDGYLYDGQLHDEPREREPNLSDHTYNPYRWPFREYFAEPVSRSPYTLDSVFAFRNPLDLKLDTPFWPNRPPAPWRIRCDDDGQWLIEKRQTVGWETHRYCATGPEAFATFAASGAR